MDLFNIIFNALSPYLFSLLKLALALTFFSNAVKIIRSKTSTGMGGMQGGGNPYSGLTVAFIGYLFGRGIPIIISITDTVCNEILKKMGG